MVVYRLKENIAQGTHVAVDGISPSMEESAARLHKLKEHAVYSDNGLVMPMHVHFINPLHFQGICSNIPPGSLGSNINWQL